MKPRAHTEDGEIPVVSWSPDKTVAVVDRFLSRPAIDSKAEHVARRVLETIRKRGDEAVAEYAAKFDKVELDPSEFRVTPDEMAQARDHVEREFRLAATDVHQRIVRYAKTGMRTDWTISSPKGGILGEQFAPMDRVGAYIPGGTAPLASTALMTVTLAKVAGVPEIVACTPCDKRKHVNPYLLYSLELAGATEMYRVGGIQAIGAMAYGTQTIGRVQKIVGPGGPYVTAAKKLLYGQVSLDSVAGPSEIAVIADDSAVPEYVAADLLSQAEHGTGMEKVLLITTSARLAMAVREEMTKQARQLSRRKAVEQVLRDGALIVMVETLDAAMQLCNRFAPEHLELMVQQPRTWLRKVKAAGAVFLGPWTPECVGDYAAGPSHVLPTGGTAAMFSGLTADDFRRRSSVIAFTSADLKEVMPVIEAFSQVEGLDGHARSARIRFQSK